jgi:small subunit ribosomal protein S6
MRHYEAMYIIDADTPDEELDAVIEKYKKIVTEAGGEVSEAGKWDKGRRQLAYEIKQGHKKHREGMYLLMQFTSDAEVPKELDRIFRINDEILRHMVVRQDPDEE